MRRILFSKLTFTIIPIYLFYFITSGKPEVEYKKENNLVYQHDLNTCKLQNDIFYDSIFTCKEASIDNDINATNIKEKEGQLLYLLSPRPSAKCQQKTVFFFNPMEQDKSLISKLNLIVMNVMSPEEEVKVFHKHIHGNLNKVFLENDVHITGYIRSANGIWYKSLKPSTFKYVYSRLTEYHRFGNFPHQKALFTKANEYRLYMEQKKKYPDEVHYMQETYILPKQKQEFLKRVGNYTLSKDNLWGLKPNNGKSSQGIRFMKSINKLPNNYVVSRYLHNPHGGNNRIYTLRLYVLITSFAPLRIYLHKRPYLYVASKDFELNINNLNDGTIVSSNFNSTDRNKELIKQEAYLYKEELKWEINSYNKYLENSADVQKVWADIKDVIIKSVMRINGSAGGSIVKLNRKSSNSIFKVLGLDLTGDDHFRPILYESNANPYIVNESLPEVNKSKFSGISSVGNIIGLIPFNHKTGKPIEMECQYKDRLERFVEESLNEFSRYQGDFERVFPGKENINIYKKFLNHPGEENEAGWNRMKEME